MAWTPTTWDSGSKGFYAALSGGGLVYTSSNYYDSTVYSAAVASAGKWYFEVTLDDYSSGATLRIGADASGTSEGGLARQSVLGAPVEGDVIGVACDFDNGGIEWFVNGVSTHAVTGLTPYEGAVWKVQFEIAVESGTATATANFGASAFAYTVPAGHEAGFGEGELFTGAAVAGTMLQAPAAYARVRQTGFIAAHSMIGVVRVRAAHDFTGALGDATTRYVMDLLTPDGAVRVPISSWQATLQTGSSNYVQCVVPACAPFVDAINTATEFVIYRRAEIPDGAAIEYEMARAPVQAQFDRGPQRHTCTLSGYSPAFVADETPPAAYDRALVAVRSISSGQGGTRVRCAVDWLLRPGHRAFADGAPLVASYINYYSPSTGDSYMDVGERI